MPARLLHEHSRLNVEKAFVDAVPANQKRSISLSHQRSRQVHIIDVRETFLLSPYLPLFVQGALPGKCQLVQREFGGRQCRVAEDSQPDPPVTPATMTLRILTHLSGA